MAMNSIVNVLGYLTLLIFLSACSEPVKNIEISTSPVEKPILTLPSASELNMREITWIVITPENFDQKITELEQSNTPLVFFSITGDDYEKLSLNLNDLRSHIEQLNAIIVAYKGYYNQANTVLNEAVIVN